MYLSRSTKHVLIICAILVGLSCLAHGIDSYLVFPFSKNYLIFICYLFAMLLWMRHVAARITQQSLRRYLFVAFVMLSLWMALRTWKYLFTAPETVAERYAWYLYYLPYLVLPLVLLLAMLQVSRPVNEPTASAWWWLTVPTLALLAGVLTNDLHHLVFRFFGDDSPAYDHGPLFFLVMLWIAGLFLAAFAVALIRASYSEQRRKLWILAIPLVAGLGYLLDQLVGARWLENFIKVPEMAVVVIAAFIELLIDMRCLPSNTGYRKFWQNLELPAGIVDKQGILRYATASAPVPALPELQRALRKEAVPFGTNHYLRAQEIPGGAVFWIQDVSVVNTLNLKLHNAADLELLAKTVEDTQAEHDLLEASQYWLQEAQALQAPVVGRIRQQMAGILRRFDADSEDAGDDLARLCFWGNYWHNLKMLLESAQAHFDPRQPLAAQDTPITTAEFVEVIRSCLEAAAFSGADLGAEDFAGETRCAIDLGSALVGLELLMGVVADLLSGGISLKLETSPPAQVGASLTTQEAAPPPARSAATAGAEPWTLRLEVSGLPTAAEWKITSPPVSPPGQDTVTSSVLFTTDTVVFSFGFSRLFEQVLP